MDTEIKSRLYQLIDSIKDENVLQMLMEDVTYYVNKKDILDELNNEQLKDLDEAILETDNNQIIDWEDSKKK